MQQILTYFINPVPLYLTVSGIELGCFVHVLLVRLLSYLVPMDSFLAAVTLVRLRHDNDGLPRGLFLATVLVCKLRRSCFRPSEQVPKLPQLTLLHYVYPWLRAQDFWCCLRILISELVILIFSASNIIWESEPYVKIETTPFLTT